MNFDFITDVKLILNQPNEANVAYGTITIADAVDLPFYLKKTENGNQLFVSFTRIKKTDGTYKGTVFLKNREVSNYVNQLVITKYNSMTKKSDYNTETYSVEQSESRTINDVPNVKGINVNKPAVPTNKKLISI